MTNAEVIQKLRACKGPVSQIAREAKVNAKNLRNLYSGKTSTTSPETLDALREWFLKARQ